MSTTRALFGTNGIRGVVNQDVTAEFATKVGAAVGTYFDGGDIFVGYDGRTSSPMIAQAVTAGLTSAGCDVLDVGLAPTPAIQYAVKHFKADGAVVVTASHNPPEYNGIKVVMSDGIEVPREEEVKIENLFFDEEFKRADWEDLGSVVRHPGILEFYKEAVKQHVDVEIIKKAHFRVVVDPANGVGALVTPYLLRELGCEVTTINSQLDGTFPGRLPEPKPETLTGLSAAVTAVKADLGIAHDGDADRAIFVDDAGTVCWGDKTGAVILGHVLQKHPGAAVVTPVSSSRVIEDVARARGAKLVWTKVGAIIVSRKMQEVNSVIGLEENGGVFYGPHQPVRDGAMAAALMLEALAKTGEKLSTLVGELPSYHLVKGRVDCPNGLKKEVLEKLIEQTKDYDRETIDGVKIFLKDGAVLIRPSGTEPIYRIYAEAKSDRGAKEVAQLGGRLLKNILKGV